MTLAEPGQELPQTMTAALLLGTGGPEMLEVRDDVAVPRPGPGDVLVRVAACGVNNTDINTRVGWYSRTVTGATSSEGFDEADSADEGWSRGGLTFPRIQGADICGMVVSARRRGRRGPAGPAGAGRPVAAGPGASRRPLPHRLSRQRARRRLRAVLHRARRERLPGVGRALRRRTGQLRLLLVDGGAHAAAQRRSCGPHGRGHRRFGRRRRRSGAVGEAPRRPGGRRRRGLEARRCAAPRR